MKQLLVIGFSSLSLFAFAQITEDFIIKNNVKGEKEKLKIISSETFYLNPITTKVSSHLYLTNPEPGIHILPMDGMPCIVPDTKDIAAIPNPLPNSLIPFKNTMPNAAPQDFEIPIIIEKIKRK